MEVFCIEMNPTRKVSLVCMIQPVEGEYGFSLRPAMVVLPGGGYGMCSDREAEPIALAYAQAGYQAFVLRYTLRDRGGWPLPLEDYDAAVDLIREHAEDWHVDTGRIAVVGFSAGGHLAACAATVARNRPAAAVLCYPAILQDLLDFCQPGMTCPADHVDAKTSPCFFAAARDDRMVPLENTLTMEMALTRAGIPFESHIFSHGDHGFALGNEMDWTMPMTSALKSWLELSLVWLNNVLGGLTPKGFADPVPQATKGADFALTLSADCHLGHLMENERARELLCFLQEAIEKQAQAEGRTVPGLLHLLKGYTLRDVLEMYPGGKEKLASLDAQLRTILN